MGDPNVQLKVSGTSSAVTWASKNIGIATVSGSGVVKAVAAGTTTITATVDGKVLECIVRVTKIVHWNFSHPRMPRHPGICVASSAKS